MRRPSCKIECKQVMEAAKACVLKQRSFFVGNAGLANAWSENDVCDIIPAKRPGEGGVRCRHGGGGGYCRQQRGGGVSAMPFFKGNALRGDHSGRWSFCHVHCLFNVLHVFSLLSLFFLVFVYFLFTFGLLFVYCVFITVVFTVCLFSCSPYQTNNRKHKQKQ